MNMRADILTGYVMLLLLTCPAFCQGADDARKHLVRGMAAIEMAKGEEDLVGAADEFKRAAEIAPDLAAAWYNLGSVQAKLGQIKDAIASYQRYLQLAPGAEDSRRVGDEIIKLEYRLEKAVAFQTKSGQWLDKDGTFYTLTTAKDKLEIRGNHFRSRDDIEYRDVIALAPDSTHADYTSLAGNKTFVTEILWSKSNGLIQYRLKDGSTWKLVKKYSI